MAGDNALQQAPIGPQHDQEYGSARRLKQRDESLALCVILSGARRLERHQQLKSWSPFASPELFTRVAEMLNIAQGKIDAPQRGVLAQVAQDVRQLKCDPRRLRVLLRPLVA